MKQRGTEKTMATYDPFLARSFIHLLTLFSRFYSLSSLCAFNLPGGRQMFAPLPSIVQPISLLFFLLLHLRVSSRHFLFPSPSVPLANVLHPSLPPLYRGSFTPFFVPNILTDSDHKESPRGEYEKKGGSKRGIHREW